MIPRHSGTRSLLFLLVTRLSGGGEVLLLISLAKETLAFERIHSYLKIFFNPFAIRTLGHDSSLEDVVVSFIQFVIRKMRIALCNLDAGMAGQFLCQLEITRGAQNGGHEIMTE